MYKIILCSTYRNKNNYFAWFGSSWIFGCSCGRKPLPPAWVFFDFSGELWYYLAV